MSVRFPFRMVNESTRRLLAIIVIMGRRFVKVAMVYDTQHFSDLGVLNTHTKLKC